MGKVAHMTTSINFKGFVPTWDIHDRLAKARRAAGFEQSELAEITGISRRTLSRYETGLSEPKRANLIAISFATGVSLDWLENGEIPAGDNPGGGKVVRHQGLEPRTH